MMNLKRLLSTWLLLALAACGGGGGSSGTSPLIPTPTTAGSTSASSLDLQLSAPSLVNSGTGTVTATVTALDANRNAMSGVAVTLTADSGVVTVTSTGGAVTDATGRVLASIGVGANHSNRTIKITATSGAVSTTASLPVVDGPTLSVPASIEVIASATSVSTAGDPVTITAFVKDANNNALPSAAIGFKASTGTLSGVSTTTNATGAATAVFASGGDKTNRSVTITVTSGSLTKTLTLPIEGTKLTISGPTALIVGSSSTFGVVAVDSKGNALPGVVIAGVSSLGNTLSTGGGSGVTDATGSVNFNYTATKSGTDNIVFSMPGYQSPPQSVLVAGDDFAFVATPTALTFPVNAQQALFVRLRSGGVPQVGKTVNFVATGGCLSVVGAPAGDCVAAASSTTDATGVAQIALITSSAGPVTIQAGVASPLVSTTLSLVALATVPAKLVLQVTPTAIAPNLGSTNSNQAKVVAKVTDPNGNPVQGQTVSFTRVIDPSGGNFIQASAKTDASGQAVVFYQSGSESTANNGVNLSATVVNTSPPVSGTATLTVNQAALFIALGTGNEMVDPQPDPQTYRKNWVAYVTDASGLAINGATLTMKGIPTFYYTGKLTFNSKVWVWDRTPDVKTGYVGIFACANEDRNGNGILDVNEDDNGDQVLWPGNVVAVSPGIVQTADGRATVSLTYAESYVPWIALKLTAAATVAGTESKTEAEFVIEGLASDFSSETKPPAGAFSPFGLKPKPGAVCFQVP